VRRRLPPPRGKGPLAIAAFLGIPLFFGSLMTSTLAQEKPRVVQWNGPKHLITMWHSPSGSTEARIWLWALLPPVLLTLIGYACTRIPYGWYVACGAAAIEALAVVHKLDTWTAHHTQRFPTGVDLIPNTGFTQASNQYNAGEWEKIARETALSLSHWTAVLAAVSILVMLGLYVRRRFFSRQPFLADDGGDVLEGVHAPTATGAGIPTE